MPNRFDTASTAFRSIVATIGSVGVLAGMIWPPTRRAMLWLLGKLFPSRAKIEMILREVQTNGGGSLKDLVIKQGAEFRRLRSQLAINTWYTQENRDRTLGYTTDETGARISVSQKWLELTGLTVAQATGWNWEQSVSADDLGRIHAIWLAMIQEGRTRIFKYHLRAADHQLIHVEETVRPIICNDGKVVAFDGRLEILKD